MYKVTAVLLDTVSIQKYVFASNKLKENIGASYIVSNIYRNDLKEAIEKVVNCPFNIDLWRNSPGENPIKQGNAEVEMGYIGGGNALLFFKSYEKARQFVSEWTRQLLVKAPGIRTAVAVDEFDFDNFRQELDRLFEQLIENKNKLFPNLILGKYGITADCPLSGLSAEVYHKDVDFDGYISSASKSKLDIEEEAGRQLFNWYSDTLATNFIFTDEIDKLGQKEGESHIAIIHMDGNTMGERFKKCQSISDIRRLSQSVSSTVIDVFGRLVKYVSDNMDLFESEGSGFSIKKDKKGNKIIPLLPVFVEGDDINFITDGRLGVHLSEKLIDFMTEKPLSDGRILSACAGVSIIKTKYPFYRGYSLAEELCASAKDEAHKRQDTSWIDFHISYGGFSGNLKNIRRTRFTINEGTLNYGPYLISKDIKDERNIYHLKKGINTFKEKWPKSKVKEFRSRLVMGRTAAEEFLKEMDKQGIKPYEIPEKSYAASGWENKKTPYFDMIELLDFYFEDFSRGEK